MFCVVFVLYFLYRRLGLKLEEGLPTSKLSREGHKHVWCWVHFGLALIISLSQEHEEETETHC